MNTFIKLARVYSGMNVFGPLVVVGMSLWDGITKIIMIKNMITIS